MYNVFSLHKAMYIIRKMSKVSLEGGGKVVGEKYEREPGSTQ